MWRSKVMPEQITVIGAGPGGYVAAIRAAQLGAEVTVMEEDNVGGTCLNWGCIPSKVMKTTAEMLEKFHRAQEFGVDVKGEILPNISALMARKQSVVQNQIKGILKLFDRHKIHYVSGHGTIQGANLVTAKLPDGETLQVPCDRLILALGSKPLNIQAFPFDGKNVISSNDALSLHEIPESLLIVGGGVIGCEFSFIFSSLGSKVTVVEALSRLLPLPSVDEDCSKILQREMKKRKIENMDNKTVNRVEDHGNKLRVTIGPSPFLDKPSERDKEPLIKEVDKVLVCIGREPNTRGIGLEELGVKMDERGWIIADEGMKTNISGVYAIGDVLGPSKVMLAHIASSEGLVAAENAMGEKQTINYDVAPGAIFTTPEIANVGLTEEQAKNQGYEIRSDSVLFRNLGKAQVMGEIAGQAKIISEVATGRILGVHLVGAHATDLIAEGTLALQVGCTVKELAETIHAHPTLAEVMLETSFKAVGKSLHG